jgi:hypothetical protein
MRYKNEKNRGKGAALLIVLLVVAAITIISLGFIIRGDTEFACGQNMELKADMDYLAESGLEHARGLILNPQDVNFTGATGQQLYTGSDYYDVSVARVSDCNWQITSTAYRKSGSVKTAQSSLTANLRLDPDVAFWSGTSVSLSPVLIINGDVYCNGVITNQGSINGDCFADSLTGNPASGSVKAKTALQLSAPAINCSILTSNFTTQTIAGNNLNNTNLNSPTAQVYYKNGNLTINSNVVINSCLAVNGNLTVAGNSNEITAQRGVPAIFVSGNLIIQENAELDCSGLVFVNGLFELPSTSSYANPMTITGSLFTNGLSAYKGLVADSSGNGYNGTMNGNCAFVSGPVGFGTAMNFDGVNSYVGVSGLLGQPARISICAWVNLRSRDIHGAEVISLGDCVSLRLDQDGTTTTGNYYRGGSLWNVTTLNKTYAGKGWHHFAYVIGNNTQTLYVDGVAAASTTYTNAISYAGLGSNTTIGCHGNGNVNFDLNGIIDDVRVYSKALSQANISSIMAGGEPAGGNLVGCWKMECGTITINAAPVKAAIYNWPGGVKDRWSPAAGAFYKTITRNP